MIHVFLLVATAFLSAPPAEDLVLDGVIVTKNPADAIALLRTPDQSRARAVRIGGRIAGYTLVEVRRDHVLLAGNDGGIRLAMDGDRERLARVGDNPAKAAAERDSSDWVERRFSRREADRRLEKEIPVIISDTELTPRVEEGRVRGLEVLRLPDGTLLSESGLLPGDVLTSLNGKALSGIDSLIDALASAADRGELRLVLERRGEVLKLAYSLTE